MLSEAGLACPSEDARLHRACLAKQCVEAGGAGGNRLRPHPTDRRRGRSAGRKGPRPLLSRAATSCPGTRAPGPQTRAPGPQTRPRPLRRWGALPLSTPLPDARDEASEKRGRKMHPPDSDDSSKTAVAEGASRPDGPVTPGAAARGREDSGLACAAHSAAGAGSPQLARPSSPTFPSWAEPRSSPFSCPSPLRISPTCAIPGLSPGDIAGPPAARGSGSFGSGLRWPGGRDSPGGKRQPSGL